MRVIRSRERTLKTMVAARAAELKTSFEAQISRQYDPRENPIWNEAVETAKAAVQGNRVNEGVTKGRNGESVESSGSREDDCDGCREP